MSRNKEKQKNELNWLYLSKTNPRKFEKYRNLLIFFFSKTQTTTFSKFISHNTKLLSLFSLKFIRSMNFVDGYPSLNEKSTQHYQYI